jgi:predicted flap endonuclease-1-like 5' DNA nuclease
MTKLTDIEGIGPTYSSKLYEQGINTVEELLNNCCKKSGRDIIAEKTGLSGTLIMGWVNRADLSRVSGVSTQYADLLECSGVDSLPELAQRNPANLHVKMSEINASRQLVKKLPSEKQVGEWVQQAGELPRIVTH